jgi:allantoinase
MKVRDHGRFPYEPIHKRPDFTWPDGKRLAVYIGLNLEHFAFGEGLGGELAPGGPAPDILNYAWREYGNRVGVWQLANLFDEHKLPISLLVNSTMYDHCPEVISRFRDRGDEIVAHGRTNSERQGDLPANLEQALIEEAVQSIAKHEGIPPRGWLGPWISESEATPDLLRAAGIGYLLDWCHDDQPSWMATRAGPILSVPYPQEINDIPAIMVRRASAREFSDMIIDQFDEMLAQSQDAPLVMGIALHAYIVGQPFRLRALRPALAHIAAHADSVWLTNCGQIADHFAEQNPPKPL